MNSKKVIYFCKVKEYSDDTALLAAEAANKYLKLYIISYDSTILERYQENIAPCLDNGSDLYFYTINHTIFPRVINDFISYIITEEYDEINCIELESGECILCEDLIGFINKTFHSHKSELTKKELLDILKKFKFSDDVKFEITKLYSIINNIRADVNCFFKGDSFFKKEVNYKRKDFSALDSLKIFELQELIHRMEKYRKTEYTLLNSILISKINELKTYTNIIPSSVSQINERQSRNNYNHDGFPSVYKFISVIQFESALNCLSSDMSNLAFLHLIRALDVYIDGYLIFIEKASLGNYQYENKRNGKIINHNDVFLLNGRMTTGITNKINEMDEDLDISHINSIKHLILLRNNLALTHGNVKVCHELCRDAAGIIKNTILKLEPKNQRGGFEWEGLRLRFRELLRLNCADLIASCLKTKFGVSKA
ncbi:hypothetical protein WH292_15880 [Enterobacter sp. MYb186]